MMERFFDIGIIDNRDDLVSELLVHSILNQIVHNPFAEFGKMRFNHEDGWNRLPNLDNALKNLTGRKNANSEFGTRHPHYFWASVNKDKVHNAIALKIDSALIINSEYNLLFEYVKKLSFILPQLSYASINPVMRLGDYYFEHNLELVPSDCVRLHVGWWHLMPPKTYLEDYTREEMLNIPAYKIKEHENGVIEMQVWENPFEYDKPENIEQLRKVVNYMRSVHKDLKGKV